MVILVIDFRGIDANKTKCHTPIAADLDGPCTLPWALQFMQVQAGQVHVERTGGGAQPAQDQSTPVCMSRLDASPAAGGKEAFETLVPKRPDRHSMSVTYMVTGGKCSQCGMEVRLLHKIHPDYMLEACELPSTYRENCWKKLAAFAVCAPSRKPLSRACRN